MRDFRENSVVFPAAGAAAAGPDHIKPCWYWDKKDLAHTPSQSEGLDPATEARYRREGARFIFDVGTRLGLHYDTLATGIIYFHRFYMFHSFKQFPRYVTGGCCLFLAGKVEETPKKCKDIIKTARSLLNDVQFAQFGDDPKEEVMVLERILLQTIKFDLQVDHPYQFLLRYAKQLKGDKNKVQKLVQMAWTFVNDSLCTMLSLQWEPEIIAVAVMYLAGRLCKFDIQEWTAKQSSRRWWEQFVQDVPVEVLEDICHQILDLYSQGKQQMPQGASAAALTAGGLGGGDKPPSTTPPAAAQQQQSPQSQVQTPAPPPAPTVAPPPAPLLTKKPSPQTSPPRPALKRTHPSPKEDNKSSELVGSKIPRLEPPMPPLPATLPSAERKAPPSYPPAPLPLPGDLEPASNPPDASSKVSVLAPPLQHQPPPLPHRPPPPPPQPPQQAASNSYIIGIPTDSSYMSGEGYQSLQSMMKTAVPPQAYAAPLGYHGHAYPPPAAPPLPPAPPAGVSSYHHPPPPPLPPSSSVYGAHPHPLPPYTHSYAHMPPPTHAHIVSMASHAAAAEYGHGHGLVGGYPPLPSAGHQGQVVGPHHHPSLPPPPPMSGMPRGGSWMR